jgi:cell shape-determining protein MreC
MNFPLKSRPKGQHRIKIISIVVLFCFLSLSAFLFPNTLRNIIYSVAKPIWTAGDFVTNSFKSVGGYFVSKNNLSKQNLSLQDQVSSLELKVIDYDTLQKQNEELKNLLGRTGAPNGILSRVLSKPPSSPYDTLIIDVGESNGISKGDKVYLSANIIVGLVTNVTPHTSLVTLFSSSGQKTESVLLRTGTTYEISGEGGANFHIEVPKDADIIWGDVFEYPSLTSSVMGSVYYIDSNSQSSFKTVYIRIPGNVFQSKWVFVERQ